MIYSLIVILAVAICFTSLFIFRKKISQQNINRILKIATIAFFTLGVLRNFLNDNFIWVINGGTYSEVYYKKFIKMGTLFSIYCFAMCRFL